MTIAVLNISVTFVPKLIKITDIYHIYIHTGKRGSEISIICVSGGGVSRKRRLKRWHKCGGVWGVVHPQTYVSVGLQMSCWSQNINC